MRMTGNEIYHGYFDQVNANIRTAMEHKSGDREQEHDSMERRNQPEAGEPPAQGYGRNENDIHMETGRASGKKQNREEKDSPLKPERPIEKVRPVKEIRQPVKGR